LEDDGIQFQPARILRPCRQVRKWLRKILMALAGAHGIEHDPQTVEVRLGSARPLRGNKTLGAHKRSRLPQAATGPTSASFGTPPTKIIFDGFTSRCTSPWRCRCPNALVSDSPIPMHSSKGRRPRSLNSEANVRGA